MADFQSWQEMPQVWSFPLHFRLFALGSGQELKRKEAQKNVWEAQ